MEIRKSQGLKKWLFQHLQKLKGHQVFFIVLGVFNFTKGQHNLQIFVFLPSSFNELDDNTERFCHTSAFMF